MNSDELIKVSLSKTLSLAKRHKDETRKYINDAYVEFLPNDVSSDIYIEEGDLLLKEAYLLINDIENNSDALNKSSDFEHLCTELKNAILNLQVNSYILKIDNIFQFIEEARAIREHTLVLDSLNKVKQLIYNLNNHDKGLQKWEYYENAELKYHIKAHCLKQNLLKGFNNLVQIGWNQSPHFHTATLNIIKDENQLQDMVSELFRAAYNPHEFCDFLLNKCLEPTIKRNASIETDENYSDYVQLKISYPLKDTSHRSKHNYIKVLNNIRLIFQMLQKMNTTISENEHVLTVIGYHINEIFLPMLIDECLTLAVPDNIEDFKNGNILKDIANFEQYLIDIYLVENDRHLYLSHFCENLESYFKNRCILPILSSMKNIFQKGLSCELTYAEERISVNDANSITRISKCMISKNILEFIKLLHNAMVPLPDLEYTNELKELTCQASMLLNAYIIEFPKLHLESFRRTPQEAAIFYNNCYFLSHWVIQNYVLDKPNFQILMNVLQNTGQKYLDSEIAGQRKFLLEILKDFNVNDEKLLKMHSLKAVQSCFHNLDLLKNVWHNALPENVYNTNIRVILDDILNFIIYRIMTIENISPAIASHLNSIIDVILEKAPFLFKKNYEISFFTPWMKIKLLKCLLTSSLQEIGELWCIKDQLQYLFKDDEIRVLIRAMFPNTDIRAKALSKMI